MTKTCQAHCRNCNLCFTSDGAFSAHIEHDGDLVIHNEPGPLKYLWGKRAGQIKFDSQPGLCGHQIGCWDNGKRVKQIPVTLWSLAVSDKERARLAQLGASR